MQLLDIIIHFKGSVIILRQIQKPQWEQANKTRDLTMVSMLILALYIYHSDVNKWGLPLQPLSFEPWFGVLYFLRKIYIAKSALCCPAGCLWKHCFIPAGNKADERELAAYENQNDELKQTKKCVSLCLSPQVIPAILHSRFYPLLEWKQWIMQP